MRPGFERPDEIQTLRISIPEKQVPDEEAAARMQHAILDSIAAVPGVVSASLSSGRPLEIGDWQDPIFAEDRAYSEGQVPPPRRFRFVAPGLAKRSARRFSRGATSAGPRRTNACRS